MGEKSEKNEDHVQMGKKIKGTVSNWKKIKHFKVMSRSEISHNYLWRTEKRVKYEVWGYNKI